MTDRVLIYRTADRPKYALKSFRHLLENTNPVLPIIVINNSQDNQLSLQTAEALEAAVEFHHPPFQQQRQISTKVFANRLGGTQALVEGIKYARSMYPDIQVVHVVDDDVLVPMPGHTADNLDFWDDVLVKMLTRGWTAAAHPWSQNFRSRENNGLFRDPFKKNQADSYSWGYEYSCVGGGCSAFRLEEFDKRPFENHGLIRGYNEWMIGLPENTVGYSFMHSMTINHFDRPEHGWSLRDTEYDDWATEMYWERWTERRNANHPQHERPKGSRGIW
jgi:hypothetical protein